MQISNYTSAAEVDNRVKRAIDLTQANQGTFAAVLLKAAQESNAPVRAAETAVPVASVPERSVDVDWSAVTDNLGRANGNFVYVGDLTRVADLAISDANEKLHKAFAASGISSNPPIDIGIGFLGSRNLHVGNHPQKSKIEALFSKDSELKNDVYDALALKERAVSWERAAIYTETYRNAYYAQGQSAADRVRDAFMSMGKPSPIFRYDQSGLEAFYGGKSIAHYLASFAESLGFSS